jgi:FKBP-type peptidyl-prolyl cis-trans isomerase 2
MSKVKSGDTVKVHYTGKFSDGEVFDTSEGKEPLEFTVGSGQVIEGFDNGVIDLQPGDKTTIEIQADKAYGPVREDLIQQVEKKHFPENVSLEQGQFLELRQPDGGKLIVKIVDVNDENVTLDANHPLAGKDLTFEVELVEIV